METQSKYIKFKFNEILQSTLKYFQKTILSEVVNVVFKQIQIQITKHIHILKNNVSQRLVTELCQNILHSTESSIQIDIDLPPPSSPSLDPD